MKILIIGGGNMGMTYAQSFLRSHIVSKDQMLILEKSPEKAALLTQLDIGTVYGKPGGYIKDIDIIIVATKPQDSTLVFSLLKEYIHSQHVVISIMAGITIDAIMEALGITKVIRAMPNLPAQVGQGMTVFSSTDDVTRIELITVQNLLNSTGKTLYVSDENLIDGATAISGSGPAYVFFFMQTMIDSAVSLGFERAQAELIAYQTFKGAVESYNKNDISCADWISKVSSKGGTTEAAFVSFNEHKVYDGLTEGYNSAYRRAVELSKM